MDGRSRSMQSCNDGDEMDLNFVLFMETLFKNSLKSRFVFIIYLFSLISVFLGPAVEMLTCRMEVGLPICHNAAKEKHNFLILHTLIKQMSSFYPSAPVTLADGRA